MAFPNVAVQISTAIPQVLGTAASGSTGTVSDAGHIHNLPTASQINSIGLPLPWNANTNVPVLIASTANTADNSFVVTVAGTTNLNGITTWFVNDIAYFGLDGAWHKISSTTPPVRTYDYTVSAASTGTAETSVLKTIQLGPLFLGSKISINFGLSGNGASNNSSVYMYLNSQKVAQFGNGSSTGVPYLGATVSGFLEIICISTASTSSTGAINVSAYSSLPQNYNGNPTLSPVTNTLTFTVQCANTACATSISYADVTVFV